MPSEWIDASHFSPDTIEFIRTLDECEVRYVIVGGEAVIFHGHVRLTGDVDFFYDLAPENVVAMHRALLKFWNGAIPGVDQADELRQPGLILQYGVPPNRIDLFNAIDGLSFEEAWRNRITVYVRSGDGEFPTNFLGLAELVRNKQAVGRPKDLEDLKFLSPAQTGDSSPSEPV